MRMLALSLNKVRHFCYSLLNGLCFSWNRRALGGAQVSCGGSAPPHCGSCMRYCNGTRDTGPNKNNRENPNPSLLSDQIPSLVSFSRFFSFPAVRDAEGPSEGSRRRRSVIPSEENQRVCRQMGVVSFAPIDFNHKSVWGNDGKTKRFY